jgi:hypothetical protein
MEYIIILIKPKKDYIIQPIKVRQRPTKDGFESKGILAAWDKEQKLIYCCTINPIKNQLYEDMFKAAIEAQSKSLTHDSNFTPSR